MGRGITRTGYSTLGVVAGFCALAAIGAASVAVQLGAAVWWVLAVALVGAAAGLFWASVRLLARGRLHAPADTDGAPPPT